MPMVILLVLVGVFGVGGYVGSDQAIGNKPEWRKMVHSPAEYNLSSETVTLQSTDGIPLKAWWLPAQQDAGTRGPGVTQAGTPESLPTVNVILVHGRDMNRSGMLPRAVFLARHNYNVLDLDLRAHGESGGNYITPGYREASDVLGGVAHIRSRGEHGPIVVLGYSYGFAYLRHTRGTHDADIPNIVSRRSVAVLPIKNLTGRSESAWLATALPEMMTTELAAGEGLRTISGESVVRMKMEINLPEADALAVSTLDQVRKHIGADLVVLGSYIALSAGKIRVDFRLQDARSGEVLTSVSETGDENNLFELMGRLGAKLRGKCGIGQMTAEQEAAVKASLPSNPEAARLYAEGLARLRVFDALGARDLLQKAVLTDPDHALAHSALAAAWSALGYDEKARQSAKNAFDLAPKLSREDRLQVEALYREASKEWDSAVDTYRNLFGYFSDNLEYGLLLARAQGRAGKGKDALVTIESIRHSRMPQASDARLDLAAADTSYFLGDFKTAQGSAFQGAEKARAQSAKLLLARALYRQGSTFERLNRFKEAIASAEEARQIYAGVNDRNGVASCFEVIANVLADQSDLDGAIDKYKEELAIVHDIGNRRGETSALNNLALVLDQRGDLMGARKMWRQAVADFREIGDKNNAATVLINIGGVFKDQGDHRSAKKTYEESLKLSGEINDQNGVATALTALATVLDAQGDSVPAKAMLEKAISIDLASGQSSPADDKLVDMGDLLQHRGDLVNSRKNYVDALALADNSGDKSTAAYSLMGLGSLAIKAGDFADARKNYERALSIRNELGEIGNVASSKVALAELAIEEGHPTEAETLVNAARQEFHKSTKQDDELAATVILIRALLSLNKTIDARRELEAYSSLAATNQNLPVRLDFALAKAHLDIVLGKTTAAQMGIKSTLAQAARAGLLGHQLEARLAQGKLQAKAGNTVQSRLRLEQLKSDAMEKGFVLIARKAAQEKDSFQ